MDYKLLKINELEWIALYCLNHWTLLSLGIRAQYSSRKANAGPET